MRVAETAIFSADVSCLRAVMELDAIPVKRRLAEGAAEHLLNLKVSVPLKFAGGFQRRGSCQRLLKSGSRAGKCLLDYAYLRA